MRILATILISFTLLACGHESSKSTIKVGTIAGPESILLETARDVAKKRFDLDIKIIEFNDYTLPNEALADGSIEVNIFQHLPYLKAAMGARGYPFEIIGKTFLYPMALYSAKHQHLNEIPEGGTIAIPNDPSNSARALLLLEAAGMISLNNHEQPLRSHIISNKNNIQIKELGAEQLPRALGDVDAAVINTNYAVPAGLRLPQDALFIEEKTSPYANLIVTRKGALTHDQTKELIEAINSEEVREKAKQIFGDAALAAW